MLRFFIFAFSLTLGYAQNYTQADPTAQHWTLQTAAFGDVAQAEAAVGVLRARGFDAYSEPSGEVARVRVGCFSDRTSAEDVAANLSQQESQIVPLSRGAGATFCVRREAGFLLPAVWGVVESTPAHITFWVDAAGQRHLRYDAQGWRIVQNPTALSNPPAEQAAEAPIRVDSLLVGSGQPLWRSGSAERQTLVVRGSDAVYTLTLVPPSEVW